MITTIASVGIGPIAANASGNDGTCGAQGTPLETWTTWRQAYFSASWKQWFECHDKGAQAGLFLNPAISTRDSEAKSRVIEKYGRCDSRPRASLECITRENVADFFHDMTSIDEVASRARLAKIWRKEDARMDEARLISIDQQENERATATIQSSGPGGNPDTWSMSFVLVDERWYVTFRWGM